MTATKERAVTFNANEIRAILEGRKTQARWALRVQPIDIIPMNVPNEWATLMTQNPNHGKVIGCRFGKPGDRLWVREPWSLYHDLDGNHPVYKADIQDHGGTPPPHDKWRPYMHMPRWASRITLEITAVRVERLQRISLESILAEGVERMAEPERGVARSAPQLRGRFEAVWNSINSKRTPWASNPWVWVISFKRITP